MEERIVIDTSINLHKLSTHPLAGVKNNNEELMLNLLKDIHSKVCDKPRESDLLIENRKRNEEFARLTRQVSEHNKVVYDLKMDRDYFKATFEQTLNEYKQLYTMYCKSMEAYQKEVDILLDERNARICEITAYQTQIKNMESKIKNLERIVRERE